MRTKYNHDSKRNNIDYSYKKKCTGCGKVDYAERSFHWDATRKDGYHGRCKECCKLKKKKNYEANKERAIKYAVDNNNGQYKEYLSLLSKTKEKAPDGCQFHHWNYDEQTVLILDRRTHSRIHSLLERVGNIYIVKRTGEVLDTFDKHYKFCRDYVDGMRDYHVIGFVDLSNC